MLNWVSGSKAVLKLAKLNLLETVFVILDFLF